MTDGMTRASEDSDPPEPDTPAALGCAVLVALGVLAVVFRAELWDAATWWWATLTHHEFRDGFRLWELVFYGMGAFLFGISLIVGVFVLIALFGASAELQKVMTKLARRSSSASAPSR